METKYDVLTKDVKEISYSVYTVLLNLGLSPSNKGTLYLKELILFVISNDLYDYSYKDILQKFIKHNNYDIKKVRNNIKNTLYRINCLKAKNNFEKYLDVEFDSYYTSPSKFLNIIALKYNN